MTRVITAVLIGLALLGGWGLVKYAERYNDPGTKKTSAKPPPTAPAPVVTGDELPGLPPRLQASLQAACGQGSTAMRGWLRTYGESVKDPRKAWIELDYCRMIARDNPSEARRVFAAVKKRTPASSPVWPRILELKNSFE